MWDRICLNHDLPPPLPPLLRSTSSLIVHRRAPTCFFSHIFLGGLKRCIPPHPLQTPPPQYLNQEAPWHVSSSSPFSFVVVVLSDTEALERLTQRKEGEKKGVIVDVDDHSSAAFFCRWRKTDSWLHPVRGSSCGCICHRITGEGYVSTQTRYNTNTWTHATRWTVRVKTALARTLLFVLILLPMKYTV